ncbi:hypothetical protein ASPWEDRAFT_43103 [Aspergillus wentii DTO 134E9]|uniref:Rhodopsin domain-containing protein n=1 Tax=Aspergillus wentii DTO 134E9 TaxID=1073089 RepID=A0A1L9RDW6_ASPWE|nr:uncharacterized protein ASPWEDRAFT_43103 [Aspergillus wentii DTO 134E9]OJJ33053.1 hypothetical protein ASPWEDRAFT_43103 [Aspergillus wentii DTO 134E9]
MGFYVVEVVNGMGMHIADIPPEILMAQMKAFWITIPFYNATVLCAKASILMQYFHLFTSKKYMRVVCWTMITMLGIYGTWCVLSAFLNCLPVAKFWDPSIEGFCLSSKGLWFSNAAMHISTDIAILVIPVPALATLALPRKQRFVLITIFALGGFVCVTSICRLVALKKISESADPTYDNVGAASWSAVECNVGIICACLPTLRPLVSSIMPHLLSTFGSGSNTYGNSPKFHGRAPTYWTGTGVSRTITHHEDPEYGDAERKLNFMPGSENATAMSRDFQKSYQATITTECKSDNSR